MRKPHRLVCLWPEESDRTSLSRLGQCVLAQALYADVIAVGAALRNTASKVEAEADAVSSWSHG